MRAFKAIALILMLAIGSCGGEGGTTSTAAEVTTTLVEESTTTGEEESSGSVAFEDLPQECIDALAAFLRDIEPVIEGVDFNTATAEDLEELGTQLEPLSTEYQATFEQMDCPDPGASDEESFDAMIELAEREAPGTVAYLEWVRGFAQSVDSAEEASGDCETDVAALETIIEEKGSMSNLTMEEVVEVGSLVSSITTACSPERAEEVLSEESVTNFLDG